jgi:3-oxoadipate enol-lactonase
MPAEPVPLRYVEYGTGGAGPVILLHGFPLVGAMWDELVPTLADRYHLIVPDLRGHGGSPVTPGPYDMSDYAVDVLQLMDSLGIERATLAGLSMGGYITMELLATAPERISAVILADTRAPGDDTDARRQGRAAQIQAISTQGLEAFAEMTLPRMFSSAAIRERPDLVERFRQIILRQKPEAVLAAAQGIAARDNVLDAMRAVRCPTLILVGSEDVVTTPADAEQLASVIPNSSLVLIEGAGHMSNWEAPEQFNRAVRDFLDSTLG